MNETIVVNSVRVKQKNVKKRPLGRLLVGAIAALLITTLALGAAAYEWNYDQFGLF